MGLPNWSRDAGSNDVADPPIYWREGQPPGTVNDSGRGMMAALACWHDDQVGALVAHRSTGDAYALATASVLKDLSRGFTLAFQVDAANTGPATLAVDGLAATPLRRRASRELAPGDLSPGIVYRVAFVPALGAFVVVSPEIAPPGRLAWSAVGALEPGYVVPDGSAVSRTAYAALFAALGTFYGAGDGATTFNLPDLRGRTLFAPDGGVGRLTGAGGLAGAFGSIGGAETAALALAHLPAATLSGTSGAAGGHDHGGSTGSAGTHAHGGTTGAAGAHGHTATADSQGSHSHSGNTQAAGDHAHGVKFNNVTSYPNGSTASATGSVGQTPNSNTGTTETAGNHAHALSIDAAGAHTHTVTVTGAADHAHTIPSDGAHAHAIPAVGDHTHGVSVNLGGGGQSHPSVPPGAVALLVLKA